LFQLRFTSKQLQRQAKKSEKDEKAEKLKLKKAIEKGNHEGAKIYAQNAIRCKSQALNFLRLSSRIDAVASRVQSAVHMKNVTKSMGAITTQLDKAMQTMNLEQITQVMDKFEKQFEDLDVQSTYVENTMSSTTTLSTPQDQVDALISQVADEHNLDLTGALGIAKPAKDKPQAAASETDELSQRLAALKSL
jgi:charged multivesicular body protein 1